MASTEAIGWLIRLLVAERQQTITEDRIAIWAEVLSDVPDHILKAAAIEVLRAQEGSFPITVGALYQNAMRLVKRALPTSGEAWEAVLRAIRQCDFLPGTGLLGDKGWGPVHALPYPIRRAAEQVGIMTLANGNTGMAERAKFVQFYEELLGVMERPILQSGGDMLKLEEIGKAIEAGRLTAPQPPKPAIAPRVLSSLGDLEDGGDNF